MDIVNVDLIRQPFHRPIECVHVPEMEEGALKVIRGWEKNYSCK